MEMSLEADGVPNVCETVCFVCYCNPKQNVFCLNVVLTASVLSLKGWVEDFRSPLCVLYILNIIFELQGEFVFAHVSSFSMATALQISSPWQARSVLFKAE